MALRGADPPSRRHALLAGAVVVHALLCWHSRVELLFDATHAYLPYARRLLGEGWSFLGEEQSVWAPFLAYGLPALFGANAALIGAVNLALSSAVVIMLYAIGARAHSPRAGLFAAWLYAVAPGVAPLVLNVSTEVPFLFFCTLWLWAFARLDDESRRRFVWLGGVALACAANTRASVVLFTYASALVAALVCIRRPAWARFAAMQGIAAALITAVVVKNWVLFDLAQVATGGGNALYLGSHTLTGGYEPFYGGLYFDVNTVAQGNQLSLAADRMLHDVAWQMLQSQPLSVTAGNYWRKLGAFLVYPNVLVADSFFTLRSLRIVLLALALVAVVQGWRRPVVALAVSVAAYQVLVHVPLLYNPRYSEGSLDLWLALLAGCGAATLMQWPRRKVAAFATGVVAACYAGKTVRHLEDRVAPLQFTAAIPHRVLWEAPRDELATLRVALPNLEGFAGNAKYGQRNFFLILTAATAADGARCAKGRVAFRPAAHFAPIVPEAFYPFRFAQTDEPQTFAFGIARPTDTWQVAVNGPGVLTLSFSCDPGGSARVLRLAVAEATYGEAYGTHAVPPPLPVVEYYNAALDHYLVTWMPDEIAQLDARADPRGWMRTGQAFRAYALPGKRTWPLCRFYVPPGLGDSHLIGFGPAECEAIERSNASYLLESRNRPAFLVRPDDGRCPGDTLPVWRLHNGRSDPNQRHVTDPAQRDAMLAKGWVLQGAGADGVAMCAPR